MHAPSATIRPSTEHRDSLADLGQKIRESDHSAFSELFEELHDPLYRYAWRHVNDDDVAADVVQRAFIRLWQGRDRIDPKKSLKAFLYTSVRNLALNHVRDEQRRRALLAEVHIERSEARHEEHSSFDAEVLDRSINQWIMELPARRREAFVLSRFDLLSHEDIAKVMNLTRNTVNTHIMLALRHLRERLERFETES